jgi:hypothetical protein
MPNRILLHRNSLNEFLTWLRLDGWKVEPTYEPFKIVQARKPGRKHPLMVYDRDGGDHLSVLERDESVVRAFIRDKRKSKQYEPAA